VKRDPTTVSPEKQGAQPFALRKERVDDDSHQGDRDQDDDHPQDATRPRTPSRQSHPRDDRRRHPKDEFDAVQDRVGLQASPATELGHAFGEDFVEEDYEGFRAL
jgi:hypothetical protein